MELISTCELLSTCSDNDGYDPQGTDPITYSSRIAYLGPNLLKGVFPALY